MFERLVYGVCDRRWDELPELYAEETHVDAPVPAGLGGAADARASCESTSRRARRSTSSFEAADLVTYEGTDPEVLIGEFAYQGDFGGQPVRIANIFSMRIRDGLIVESRDYGDHLGIAGDTGQIPELAARL